MGAVTKQGRNASLYALAVVAVAWIGLVYSGRGLLVWFTQPSDSVGMLKCQYFTGAELIERQFLYTKQGILGRDTCPRTIELTK